MQGFRTFGDLPDDTDAPPVLAYCPQPARTFPWNLVGLCLALAGALGIFVAAARATTAMYIAILVCAALAVVFSIKGGLAQPATRGLASRAARYVGCILGGLVLVAGLMLVVDNRDHRTPAHCARCANNLRQIGLAAQMYANQDPLGRYPATPNLILETQDIMSEVFVCPASSDTRAIGPTTQATAANLTAGGHLSYVYVGAGLTTKSDPKSVLAYELKPLHSNVQNFVYLDAHVEYLTPATAASIIAELNAGHNPPRPEKIR